MNLSDRDIDRILDRIIERQQQQQRLRSEVPALFAALRHAAPREDHT